MKKRLLEPGMNVCLGSTDSKVIKPILKRLSPEPYLCGQMREQ